ncbi:MAG: trypsin-like peptidase domain-containing protein [Caldilineaceae bacterium]|nr:trypsin-like peptidase domain-containing protein [Caldilineaceae bacterium]
MDLDSKLHNMTTLILTKTPQGAVAQGTGFFYRVSEQADPGGPEYQWVQTDIWVITNRHVVMPKVSGVETFPSSVTIHLRREDTQGLLEWAPVVISGDDIKERVKFHPNERVDVAAIDVSKLFVQELDPSKNPFTYAAPFCLSRDLLARNNKEIRIEASSDVLVVGYPRGFYDSVNLFPIVKSGIVASRWGSDFQGDPCFLIDAKLFPGSSGSVVISKPIDITMKDGRLLVLKNDEKAFALLGVFSSEPQTQSQPVAVGDLTITQTLEYGLGVVWYATVIEELLGDRARFVRG